MRNRYRKCRAAAPFLQAFCGPNRSGFNGRARAAVTRRGVRYRKSGSGSATPRLRFVLQLRADLREGPAIAQILADRKPEARPAPQNGTFVRVRLQEMLGYINSEVHKTYSPLFKKGIPAETRSERKAYL